MLVPRLGCTVSTLYKINRPCLLFQRSMSKKSSDDDDDKPIPYSTSPAASWKAEYNRNPPNYRVWYTPYVVSASVSIFMIYFCILREENDIDERIYQPLSKTLVGIEKVYPNFNFDAKPDYVLYHEKVRQQKAAEQDKK